MGTKCDHTHCINYERNPANPENCWGTPVEECEYYQLYSRVRELEQENTGLKHSHSDWVDMNEEIESSHDRIAELEKENYELRLLVEKLGDSLAVAG